MYYQREIQKVVRNISSRLIFYLTVISLIKNIRRVLIFLIQNVLKNCLALLRTLTQMQNKLAEIVGHQIEQSKTQLYAIRRGYNDILNGSYVFRITLISRWFNEGEKDVIEEVGPELPEVILKAEKSFKERFNRLDVQADRKITVLTNSGYTFVLPPSFDYDY